MRELAPASAWRRHALLDIDPGAAQRVAQSAAEGDRPRVLSWLREGNPLVLSAQRGECGRPGALDAGLPLPPHEGKRRLRLVIDARDLAAVSAPPLLVDALPALAGPWREPLAALAEACARLGLELRVFGSIAWQAITGMAYVTARSDVDLLWAPRNRQHLENALDLLARWQPSIPLRLDGEMILGAHEVAWREWRQGGGRVLAKSMQGPSLRARAGLLAGLEPAAGGLATIRETLQA